jgi:hypothetical protein
MNRIKPSQTLMISTALCRAVQRVTEARAGSSLLIFRIESAPLMADRRMNKGSAVLLLGAYIDLSKHPGFLSYISPGTSSIPFHITKSKQAGARVSQEDYLETQTHSQCFCCLGSYGIIRLYIHSNSTQDSVHMSPLKSLRFWKKTDKTITPSTVVTVLDKKPTHAPEVDGKASEKPTHIYVGERQLRPHPTQRGVLIRPDVNPQYSAYATPLDESWANSAPTESETDGDDDAKQRRKAEREDQERRDFFQML